MRRLMMGLLLVLVVASLGQTHAEPNVAVIDPEIVGYPQRIVAFGDSITRAFLADGNIAEIGDQPQYSWVTGNSPAVNSLTERIRAVTGVVTATNLAVTGARMEDLVGQVRLSYPINPQYATIFMGANDVCRASEAGMTTVANFRSQFNEGMNYLIGSEPNVRVFVVSIPDVFQLWQTFKDNATARFIWNQFDVCQSMFVNPQSTATADVERRQRVRQRIIDFNTQLSEVCRIHVRCRFDQNLVFNTPISPTLVTADYFHPSIAGQQALADKLAQASFDFSDQQAPVSKVEFTQTQVGWLATMSATDNRAVHSLEYRSPFVTQWTQYTQQPIEVGGNHIFIVRAIDVNGNTEGSRAWIAPSDYPIKAFLPLTRLN